MDVSQFAGQDYVEVILNELTYKVGELTLGDWAPIQAWIKAKVPGPLSILGTADFQALPPLVRREVQSAVIREAQQSWPPKIGSTPWFLALDSPEGHAVLLLAILGKYQPSITLEGARLIGDSITNEEVPRMVAAALGYDLSLPKSPAPPQDQTAATGPTTDPRPTTSATCPTS